MYHDQGLTPFKTLSFFDGVNYTSGLDIIRTSPMLEQRTISREKHCDEQSFRESIFVMCEIFKKRKETFTTKGKFIRFKKGGRLTILTKLVKKYYICGKLKLN